MSNVVYWRHVKRVFTSTNSMYDLYGLVTLSGSIIASIKYNEDVGIEYVSLASRTISPNWGASFTVDQIKLMIETIIKDEDPTIRILTDRELNFL